MVYTILAPHFCALKNGVGTMHKASMILAVVVFGQSVSALRLQSPTPTSGVRRFVGTLASSAPTTRTDPLMGTDPVMGRGA
jgi:hypothetical protein